MLYLEDLTVYTGELCEKSVTLTNNRQVAQSLDGYAGLTLTIETLGTTKTTLLTASDDSSDAGLDRSGDAIGVLAFMLTDDVTALANAGKNFRLAVRESTTKEVVASCNVFVAYEPGGN